MGSWRGLHALAVGCLFLTAACGGTSSNPASSGGSESGNARVRFAQGAPELETLIDGAPQDIGQAYLRVDGQTVASTFSYGSVTPFASLPAGRQTLSALDELGYEVGPFQSDALTGGKRYTLVLVGTYPNYRVLTFEEPASTNAGGQLSFYEASPAEPAADFGSFTASSRSNFKALGHASLGEVASVSLGKSVSNFGGYAGRGTQPFTNGALTLANLDSFDKRNALPFHNASRLSLFLFDAKAGSSIGPVVGSLDQ
jgi:Domain of unknown function (DUF4397)